ncbi:MAG: beta-glucosidase BglX [Ferruginibacter sp.]
MKFIQPYIFIALIIFSMPVQAQVSTQSVAENAKMNIYVSNLMKKMTLEEKIGQLNLLTPGGGIATGAVVSSDVEQKIAGGKVGGLFGVIGEEKIRQAQELAMAKSRLKIPLIFGSDIIHGYKTTFPIPLGLSCSWDMNMIQRSARVAASEATADGLTWAFSPMVDIARDPRWGRSAEGAGEDPYLGSQVAKAMVTGYQGNDLSAYNTLLACVKHFALYGGAEGGREYNTTDMSMVKMYNDYLPPYKAAIEAGSASVMTSFNTINNIPATGNKWLLTDLLRRQWGFKGFVVSDYTAVNELTDHGMGNLQQVSALALNAGMDMDMVGEGYLTTLKKSLQEGKTTQRNIDDACRRILEAKYKLGLFTDPFRYCNPSRAQQEVLSPANRQAAREFATHSMVLLKNNNQVLPLTNTSKIALIGPLANDKSNMLGTWAVSGDAAFSIPVLEGIKNRNNNISVSYAKGANISDDTLLAKKVNVFGTRIDIDKRSATEMLNEALDIARNADIIVTVVGEASEMSGESASRSDINIPASQKKLLEALYATGKPVVLVIMAGRPLTIKEELEKATSILYVYHAGHEAGNAIADVLYGNYNPSGKLTNSFPRNVGQVPIYYNHLMTGRPNPGDTWQKFRSNYIDVENSPLLPFGYGLSYTSFSYGNIALSSSNLTKTGSIICSITVTNTGNFDGEEVVQLYTRDMVGSIARPVQELKGFQKIMLKKGESRKVSFTLTANDLKFYNSNLVYASEPGDFKVFIGGNSRDVKEADFKLVN